MAAVAGVVIAGLAIGAAIGIGLRKAFGEARAVRAEEAQSKGALIVRAARAAVEKETGRAITRTEARKIFDAYAAQLEQLGFERVPGHALLWHRPRSAVEKLLG